MSHSSEPSPLETIATSLRDALVETNAVREETLKICREVIQHASRTIRAVHRGEMENARNLCDKARDRVNQSKSLALPHPEVYFAGYVHDAHKEYVEAEAMLSIIQGQPLPTPEALGVEIPAYLNGLAEAASESRRYVLDCLRLGNITQAEAVLKLMDDIYYELTTFDFPDAITGGLRRTTDALRAVLERTRADVTTTLSQQRLERAILDGIKVLETSSFITSNGNNH